MWGKVSIVNVDGVDGAQIGERFFRRAKAKTQGNLGGFPRLLPKSGGKSTAKMRAGSPISVYKKKNRAADHSTALRLLHKRNKTDVVKEVVLI